MRFSKFAALAIAATVLTSTIGSIPASAIEGHVVVASSATPFHPNVGVTIIFASTASVILDAIYVAATQCRELTAAEAGTAVLLPGVGPIYNATQPAMNHCKK